MRALLQEVILLLYKSHSQHSLTPPCTNVRLKNWGPLKEHCALEWRVSLMSWLYWKEGDAVPHSNSQLASCHFENLSLFFSLRSSPLSFRTSTSTTRKPSHLRRRSSSADRHHHTASGGSTHSRIRTPSPSGKKIIANFHWWHLFCWCSPQEQGSPGLTPLPLLKTRGENSKKLILD